jgi:hypothetical protein
MDAPVSGASGDLGAIRKSRPREAGMNAAFLYSRDKLKREASLQAKDGSTTTRSFSRV